MSGFDHPAELNSVPLRRQTAPDKQGGKDLTSWLPDNPRINATRSDCPTADSEWTNLRQDGLWVSYDAFFILDASPFGRFQKCPHSGAVDAEV
jgi:hypothetical protein